MSTERELVFHAERKDFRIDTYRGTGPGGQHRNKTDSCVRITHIESGLSASCCESRSQAQNRKTAFRRLAAQLVNHYVPARAKVRNAAGDTVVRTYNEPDNRVRDHLTGEQQPYRDVMNDPSHMIHTRRDVGNALA